MLASSQGEARSDQSTPQRALRTSEECAMPMPTAMICMLIFYRARPGTRIILLTSRAHLCPDRTASYETKPINPTQLRSLIILRRQAGLRVYTRV